MVKQRRVLPTVVDGNPIAMLEARAHLFAILPTQGALSYLGTRLLPPPWKNRDLSPPVHASSHIPARRLLRCSAKRELKCLPTPPGTVTRLAGKNIV